MLLKVNLKRIISLLTLVFMLATFTPVIADDAVDVNVILDTTFEMGSSNSIAPYVCKDFSTMADSTFKFINGNASTVLRGVWIQNPDTLSDNDENSNYVGTSTAEFVADGGYANAIHLEKSSSSARPNFGVMIQTHTAGGPDTETAFDSNSNVVIQTAIKRTKMEGSNFVLRMSDAADSAKNFEMVTFSNDGKLYGFNGTPVGLYSLNVWYDIKIEYSPSTKYATLTIDGGEYGKSTLYNVEMSGNAAKKFYAVMNNDDVLKGGKEADAYVGYLKIYTTSPKSIANYESDQRITFEEFPNGTFVAENNYYKYEAGYHYGNGISYNQNGATAEQVLIEKLDDAHGKSLKIAHNGKMNQIKYPLSAPHATNLDDGVAVFEYSFHAATGMSAMLLTSTQYSEDGTTTGNKFFSTSIVSGTNFVANKWYKVIAVYDKTKNTYKFTAYNPDDPSSAYTTSINDITNYGYISSICPYVGKASVNDVSEGFAYMDDLALYTSANLALSGIANINNDTTKTELAKPVVASYNTPLSSADVKLICNGVEVAATKSVVGKTISVIPASGAFAPESNYKIELTDITDVFGNKTDKTIEFTTGKKYTLTYQLVRRDSTTGEITPIDELEKNACIAIELSSNDGTKFGLRGGVGVYDKATNELLKIIAWNMTAEDQLATSRSWTNMPTQIDNPDTQYVKLFVWEADMTPMHEAVTFSK